MTTLKEKIISELNEVKNNDILIAVQNLLLNFGNKKSYVILNEEQQMRVNEAREEYKKGDHFSTDEVFDDLEK